MINRRRPNKTPRLKTDAALGGSFFNIRSQTEESKEVAKRLAWDVNGRLPEQAAADVGSTSRRLRPVSSNGLIRDGGSIRGSPGTGRRRVATARAALDERLTAAVSSVVRSHISSATGCSSGRMNRLLRYGIGWCVGWSVRGRVLIAIGRWAANWPDVNLRLGRSGACK